MNTEALIDALRRELDGYVRRGMAERAAAVRQELTRLGCSTDETPGEVVPAGPGGTPQKATRKKPEPPPPAPKPSPKRKRAES